MPLRAVLESRRHHRRLHPLRSMPECCCDSISFYRLIREKYLENNEIRLGGLLVILLVRLEKSSLSNIG
jgi:hypothetical protein